jgi:hypothetical protein
MQDDLVPGSSALLAAIERREGVDLAEVLRNQLIISRAKRIGLLPAADLHHFREQLEQAQTSLLGTPLDEPPK